jgi:Carboxypeptidase regulatory-like domain/TonB-dependent Receptor Plug Domain
MLASPFGGIAGTVRDPSGAPVVGSRVLATCVTTGAQAAGVSDLTGSFRFLQLAPGVWSITVEADRFKRAHISEAVVQVDQLTRADVSLELGDRSEVIQVEAERSVLTGVVDTRTIRSVPLNGRQFLDLALFTPGIVPAAPGTQGSGFNSSGIRSQSNVYLLDGVSNQDTQTNGPLNLFRITDAVQEFAVQTGVPSPEFGRGAGGQVNIVTKGGSNVFHGSAFEYLRNTALNAADFFTNKLAGTKAGRWRY